MTLEIPISIIIKLLVPVEVEVSPYIVSIISGIYDNSTPKFIFFNS